MTTKKLAAKKARPAKSAATATTKTTATVKKPVAKKVVPKTGTTSKAELARAIYHDNPKATRQELLKLFMDDAGLTAAGSATYLANIRRELKNS